MNTKADTGATPEPKKVEVRDCPHGAGWDRPGPHHWAWDPVTSTKLRCAACDKVRVPDALK